MITKILYQLKMMIKKKINKSNDDDGELDKRIQSQFDNEFVSVCCVNSHIIPTTCTYVRVGEGGGWKNHS